MSHQEASHLEGVISALSEMEKELDVIKASVEEMKRSLVALAREQAEQVKNQIVSEANGAMKEELDRATQEAQMKAKEIMAKSEAEVKKLQSKIDASFDKAADAVVKAVLGD
ncbi:MAG: hypothetical protein HYU02_07155 [Thaumarchaeota archaeon]|nr:hypothetical protein [Nitrososphaerota archaeon]